MEKIIQKIKDFEQINNGIDQAFIDISDIKKVPEGIACTISVYNDDSNKSIYSGVVYPQKLFTNL